MVTVGNIKKNNLFFYLLLRAHNLVVGRNIQYHIVEIWIKCSGRIKDRKAKLLEGKTNHKVNDINLGFKKEEFCFVIPDNFGTVADNVILKTKVILVTIWSLMWL